MKPSPWHTIRNGRRAVTAGFFWRRDPAALLRGLANGGLPSATRLALRFSKSASMKNTSPRTSSTAGVGNFFEARKVSGTSPMVRALSVTSSPTRPSPRVAARSSFPSR